MLSQEDRNNLNKHSKPVLLWMSFINMLKDAVDLENLGQIIRDKESGKRKLSKDIDNKFISLHLSREEDDELKKEIENIVESLYLSKTDYW